MTSTSGRRAAIVLGAIGGLVLGVLGAVPGAATAAPPTTAKQVNAPVPTLDWAHCSPGSDAMCATAAAPLDYDDPTGPTVLLDLVKIPANNPGQKLGTLFVNPGGPGGSATQFAPFAGELLGKTVRNRYDVIGIDPRGVGEHSMIVCRATQPVPRVRVSFPITQAQSKKVWRAATWERTACQQKPNRIVAHMSTADTARDMDLIRQAVGEDHLDYYGISYGTYLGATYAALFPDRVGRFVVDGVLDPVAWATTAGGAAKPFSTRINSAQGAYEALTSALTECDRMGASQCRLAGDATAKWHWMIRKAKQGKLRVSGARITYQDLVDATLYMMYDNNSYRDLALVLQRVWKKAHHSKPHKAGDPTAERMRKMADRFREAPYAARQVKIYDAFAGVACADTPNPTTRAAWWKAGRAQDRQSPWFGSSWTWASAPCAKWPSAYGQDSFRGPFDANTANPILVVGNSHDPATPVSGARRFTTLFEGSRFLLMDGWGHGALGNSCVTDAFNSYYATGALPREGTVCPKDKPLFRR